MENPTEKKEIKYLKVGSNTDAQALKLSIVANLREDKICYVRCIGAAAISQSIKAHILANETFSSKGQVIKSTPFFEDVPDTRSEEPGKKITSIVQKLTLESI